MKQIHYWISGIFLSVMGFFFYSLFDINRELGTISKEVELIEIKLDKNVYYSEKDHILDRLAKKRTDMKGLEESISELELNVLKLEYKTGGPNE